MTKLISIVLVLAVSATAAAPDGKLASAGENKPTHLTGFTPWEALFLLRDGAFNPSKTRDFNDSRFEYRWKSEWVVNGYVCTVEVRHTDDAEDSHTLPEIDVFYVGAHPPCIGTRRARWRSAVRMDMRSSGKRIANGSR